MAEASVQRRLAAILAADVVAYSALMERDEAGTFERLKSLRKELLEPAINRHRGRIFKLMGDGLLAEFASVFDAVECAVAIQRKMAERNTRVGEDERIEMRIGVNLGEVIVEGRDRHGEGVNIAARLQQLAPAGGICVSGKVAKEVERKLGFEFVAMGEQRVKNIAEPIPVYRVRFDGMSAPPAPTAGRRTAPRRWAAGAILTLLLAGAASWYAFLRPGPSAPGGTSTVPTIAVLPFDNMSDDPTLGYMGDGIAEDIITTLSRFPDLSVIARNSSFTYRGKPEDVRKIGKDLGVNYVLEGSVRKGDGEMRIAAQLIDTTDGKHLWADRFDKSGSDPLALQDEVTTRIVDTLVGESGQIKKAAYQRAWGKDTAGLAEYDYYLRGSDFLTRNTKEDYRRAAEIFQEGLTKFPNSNLLKAKLGFYHFFNAFDYYSDDPEFDYRRAGELAREVLSTKPLTPHVALIANALMAWVRLQERYFGDAIAYAESAKALNPYDAGLAGLLATVLIMSGRPDQGIEWTEAALAKNPAFRPMLSYRLGLAYSRKGDNERSVAALKEAPEWPDILLLRAIGYLRLGNAEKAGSTYSKALAANPSFTQASWRKGYFYDDPAIVEGQVADLAKLGLPEK